MNSMLYSDRTIETKYFLLSNLKYKEKYGGFVRKQEFCFTNYYGEEIKDPIYETPILTSIQVSKNKVRIKPLDLFKIKNKSSNKSLLYGENYKLSLNESNKSSKGLQAKIRKNLSTKKKVNLNVVKMNFPYCKPFVKNSFTELFEYNKNRDFIIAKNIEKNKNKM